MGGASLSGNVRVVKQWILFMISEGWLESTRKQIQSNGHRQYGNYICQGSGNIPFSMGLEKNTKNTEKLLDKLKNSVIVKHIIRFYNLDLCSGGGMADALA